MASQHLQRSAYRQPISPRRRAAALALAVGLVALLILALLRLGAPARFDEPGNRSLSTFDVGPAAERRAEQPRRVERRAAARLMPAPPKAPPPPLPPTSLRNPAAPAMLAMSLGDTDIGKMARAPRGDEGADDGKDSVAPYGPGGGPGGARLYEAEWYREPPANAMALYLPGGAPPGAWATIACRTVPNYRVDNCRQLDDFPRGQGLSSALRQAAWQFQVRPPRLGGKPLIGAWVRIRFYWTKPPADG